MGGIRSIKRLPYQAALQLIFDVIAHGQAFSRVLHPLLYRRVDQWPQIDAPDIHLS
jgi:hypothetical protein